MNITKNSTAFIDLNNDLRSIKAVLFLVIFISIINVLFYKGEGEAVWSWWRIAIYYDGIVFATKMALRLILLVTGPALLTYTTTPMELTNAIESLLSPLKVIRFPVHDLAIIMSIALRMVPTLMEETDKISLAQKARGADLDTGSIFSRIKAMVPILIPLFVGAFRRADELALAMESRCYNATPNRTRYKVLKLTFKDYAFFFLFAAFFAAVLLDYILISPWTPKFGFIEGFYDSAFCALFGWII